MIRNILAVLSGIIFGILTIGIVESIGHKIFTVPQEVTQTIENADTDAVFALVSSEMLLFVLVAYIIGSFVGGFITELISKRLLLAVVTGSILMLGGVLNLFMIPHPIWFVLVSILVYIPFAWLGGLLSKKIINHL
jgi:cytochrome c biogenesis protein CcdA